MNNIMKFLGALMLSFLVACGGGGATSTPTPATTTYSISGTTKAGTTLNLSGQATANTTADANGNFSFTGLANGSYTVTPALTGYSFTPTSQAVTVSNADVSGVTFTATANTAPTYSISGTVSGAVSSGVTLSLSPGGASTVTDANGNFSFTGLANGSYTVTPSLTGYSFTPTSQAVIVNNADVSGVTFTATANTAPTYSISGTVSGAVSSGVTITLSPGGATTMTDANGNYVLSGLVNGGYTVTPSRPGHTFTPSSASVSVNDANVTSVNFVEPIPMLSTGKLLYPCSMAICVKDLTTGAESAIWGQQYKYPDTFVSTRNGGTVAFKGANLNGIHVLTLSSSTAEQKTWANIEWAPGCSSWPEGSFDTTQSGDITVFASRCMPGGGVPEYRDVVLMKLDGTMYWSGVTNDTNFDASPAICGEDTTSISVCFLSNKSGAFDIWKQVLDKATGNLVGGQTLVVGNVVDGVRAMSVNVGYTHVAFMRKVGGITHIFVRSLTDGSEVDLIVGTDPYWATDGSNRIMYTDNSALWVVFPDGTGKAQVPIPSNIVPNSLGGVVFGPVGY